jgi:hypothetical protein
MLFVGCIYHERMKESVLAGMQEFLGQRIGLLQLEVQLSVEAAQEMEKRVFKIISIK